MGYLGKRVLDVTVAGFALILRESISEISDIDSEFSDIMLE